MTDSTPGGYLLQSLPAETAELEEAWCQVAVEVQRYESRVEVLAEELESQ